MPVTVEPPSCERLGLSANPFRETSPRLAEQWHVPQSSDDPLAALQAQALDGGAPHVAVIVGGPGSGKTHALQVAAARAARAGAFHAFQSAGGCRPDALVARLASAVLAGCQLGGLEHALAAPRWYRNLIPMTRRGPQQADPNADGHDLARALNANAPAFLLVDDLHALPISRAADAYGATLAAMRRRLDAGVLLAWTCDPRRLEALVAREPLLLDGEVAPVLLPRLSDREAARLVEKRLATHRLADNIDPLFPFRAEGIARMNREARGNPQALVRLAELMVEAASHRGAFELGADALDDPAFLRPASLARVQVPPDRRERRTAPQ